MIQCHPRVSRNNVQAHFEGTFSNATRNGAMIDIHGDGWHRSTSTGDGYVALRPSTRQGQARVDGYWAATSPQRRNDFYDKPDGERLHLVDWLEAIRSRRKPACPAEAGVSAASAAHMGNLAYRNNRVETWGNG